MWILSAGDDQVHLWRQVLDQKGEGLVNRSSIDYVVVVKHKDEVVREGGDLIEQSRQYRFGWWRLRGLKRSQRPCSNIRRNRLRRRDEVSEKTCGIVIPFV